MRNHFPPLLFIAAILGFQTSAEAGIIQVAEGAFNAQAGLITFSEKPFGTVNPTYAPADYGGGVSAPTVTFGGFFTGQSLGTAATCPAGAALTGCVIGSPSNALTLDPTSPSTSIVNDGANPTSPVLSGSPIFNGPVSILFSTDQYGVGLNGGFFNNVASTGITAFARDGSVIGTVANSVLGIEFLGLVTSDGLASIAGLQFHLVGNEPAGFAIDNVRFGVVGQVNPNPTPEPASLALFMAGLAAFRLGRKKESL